MPYAVDVMDCDDAARKFVSVMADAVYRAGYTSPLSFGMVQGFFNTSHHWEIWFLDDEGTLWFIEPGNRITRTKEMFMIFGVTAILG
jgi:hypothetical protein